jgi:hypothetical protein
MFGARMPKAPVDENCNPLAREDDIGTNYSIIKANRKVLPESCPSRVELGADSNLRA